MRILRSAVSSVTLLVLATGACAKEAPQELQFPADGVPGETPVWAVVKHLD